MTSETKLGNRKVAIIGAGYVGSTIAYALTLRNLAREIVLIDINTKKAHGEALDIQHGIPYMGISSVYEGSYQDCSNCDMIIITAGRGRRPGETRLNLAEENSKILQNVIQKLMKYYTRGVILIISNPVDILTTLADEWLGLPNGMVFGTGCILDTSRIVRVVADYLKISTEVVKGDIVGEHGDSQIPIWSNFTIGGIPIENYCTSLGVSWNENKKIEIDETVKKMGSEIIEAKQRTHYGIATCVCLLADAIINQRLTIASVTSPLQGEYGVRNVSMSVPSIIGVNGVEKRLEENWSNIEYNKFKESSERLQTTIQNIRKN